MSIPCNIEKFEIYKGSDCSVVHMNGHFDYVSGNMNIYAVWDDKKEDTHALILPEEHGNGAVRHRFVIVWKGFQDTELLQFILKDENGSNVELRVYSKQELQEHTSMSSIVYNIENLFFRENHVAEIAGWAFSSDGMNLTYRIVNEKGEEVQSSLRRTVRQSLYERKAITYQQKLCGLILSFPWLEEHTYSLEISKDIENISIPLNGYVPDTSMNAGKLAHLLRMVNKKNLQRGIGYLKMNGLSNFMKRLSQGVADDMDYDAWFRRNRITASELESQKATVFPYQPQISIIVPTFNTPMPLLKEMVNSVKEQSYDKWQLCIADGSDADSETRKQILKYQSEDNRIKVKLLDENLGISRNTNQALALADGEYTGLFDHDDLLEPDALFEVVKSLQKIHHDIIYTDEDKLNDSTKHFEDPNFKPDYDEDLLLSNNYITHFFVVKTAILKGIGGFHQEYDGSQDYDVIFRCIEQSKSIFHIAKCLYHWRIHEGSTAMDPKSKMYCYEAGQRAIQDHLNRCGILAKVELQEVTIQSSYHVLYHVVYNIPDALVSIIIPNKDHTDILKTCLDSLFNGNNYQNIEIIIVENNSQEKATFNYYEQLKEQHSNVKIITWNNKVFNYSAVNNYGAEHASGDYLLFLNNDTEMIDPDSLKEMVGLCSRSNVGAVGAKLLFEDGTIQHAGVMIGFNGYAGHVFNDVVNGKECGYMMRDMFNGDYNAVTAACMLTKKSVFDSVGGFDQKFVIACNDVDYCLKIREKGMLVVYNANALWHHFESKSRGYENDFTKIVRFDQEVKNWQEKWKSILLDGDVYYNLNFKVENEPFHLQ